MNNTKIKCCIQRPPLSKCASGALLLLRVIAGSAFIIHGFAKMHAPTSWMGPEASVPGFLQFLAAFAEFGGGIAWIIGLLTPLASLGIAITMTVATYVMMVSMAAPFVSLTGGMSGELGLAFFGIAILLMIMGPGKFSLDAKIFGEKQ